MGYIYFWILKNMNNRVVMQTENFQKLFPDVYKSFYVKHDLVLSWNFSCRWWINWIGHNSKNLRIKQKIPAKCYIWFKKLKTKEIRFNEVSFYNPVSKSFETYPYSKVNQEEQKVVEYLLNYFQINDFDGWVEVNILSEIWRGHWFSFSWTTWAIIAMWIFLILEKLWVDYEKNYSKFIKSQLFDEVFRLAWKYEFLSKYGNPVSDGLICCLLETASPVMFFSEEFQSNVSADTLDNVNYKYEILSEKFDSIITNNEFPLDYCVVYSWFPSETAKIEKYIKSDMKKYNTFENFLSNYLEESNIDYKNLYLSKFVSQNSMYQSFNDVLIALSIMTLYYLKEIFEKWYNLNTIDEFISVINNFKHSIQLIEWENSFIRLFDYFFEKNKVDPNEKLWIYPVYSGKVWWGYMVVMKEWKSRNTLNKIIEDLKSVYPSTEVEYSSYIDGVCGDWIKIEQFLSQDIYSRYLKKWNYIYKDTLGNKFVWTLSEIFDKYSGWLLLDSVSNKIYLDWDKLTSKDIHSQNSTIEIFGVLLDNMWEFVNSKYLPLSSYSKNKNEMITKIYTPINKFLEEKIWKSLPVSIKWSLIEYNIKLDNPDFKIWIINKIE